MADDLLVTMSKPERKWLEHAAALVRLTPREYVIRAINEKLQRQGVDAVLLRERGAR